MRIPSRFRFDVRSVRIPAVAGCDVVLATESDSPPPGRATGPGDDEPPVETGTRSRPVRSLAMCVAS
ncbi:hypothetical protein GCM10009814_39910 [Lapillicoccus jejuensis]